MAKKSNIRLIFASIPFITLILAIPFVNKLEPMIWGMPFLLWWLVVNVTLTPVWLSIVYLIEKQAKMVVPKTVEKGGAGE